MAHAYRIAEHYIEPLLKLNNAKEWAQSDELNTANYWKCVFSSGSDFYLSLPLVLTTRFPKIQSREIYHTSITYSFAAVYKFQVGQVND